MPHSGLPGSGYDSRYDQTRFQIQSSALYKLSFALISVASEVFAREYLPYKKWPWALAQLVDNRLSTEQKEALGQRFLESPACCKDEPFGVRLCSAMSTASDILPGHRLFPAVDLMSCHKVHNIEVEDNFARACAMRSASKGQQIDWQVWQTSYSAVDSLHLYTQKCEDMFCDVFASSS